MAISAARLVVEVGADTSDAEQGVTKFSNNLDNISKKLAKTGGGLSLAVTAPLVGIATAALDSAGEFEQSLNILQQVVGATEGQMASLQKEALRLGAVTSFSAGEAAQGMLELGKAGMDTNDIMASIGGVMDLAAAAGVSLGEAAGITAAALNAFGLEASESTRVADLLAAAANASAADITDLSQGLKQAGFAFDLANQPIENLVASLAILTNVGLTGSDAGTALKNAFMRMMNPTQEAASLMKELNISFYDAQGNMKMLPDIIDNLNVAMANLTPQQRDAALATIFLSDGMKAMIPLMDEGKAGFNAYVTEVTKTGAATEVANARMQGLRGGIEYLKGSIDSFLIGTALPFTNFLGEAARGVGDAITAFGALPQPIINASLAFAGVLAAAGPLMLALAGLSAALAFLVTPMGLVVTAAAALAAAWAADIGGIQGITANVATQVQQSFSTMLTEVQQLAGGIATAFANTQFPSLQTLWEQFKAGDFQTVADTIRNTAFELMINLDTELNITGKANELKAQLVGVVNSLSTAVSNLDFGNVSTNMSGLRDGLLSGLSAAIEGVDWGQGGSAFAGMVNSLSSAIRELDFSGIDWAGVLRRVLLGPLGAAINGIQWVIGSGEFEGLKSAVTGAIGEINWGELGVAFGGLGTAISEALGRIVSDIASDLGLSGVRLPEFKLPEIDIDWGQLTIDTVGLVNHISEQIGSINWMGVGASVGSALVDAVALGVQGIGAAIQGLNWANEAINSLKAQALGWAVNVGVEIGNALRGIDLLGALQGLDAAIKAAIGGVLGGALAQIGQELHFAFNLPKVDWNAVMEAFSWAEWINPMAWSDWVQSLSWEEFIASIDWASFVPSIDWGSFVPNINWSSFVPDINWGSFIPDMGWGDFIPSLNWGAFIPSLFGGGGGGSADSPGLSSGGSIGGNATGAPFWRGGLTWVGERGPELVSLPRGSRIYNNHESMALAAGGITINVQVAQVASDMDIHSLANRLAHELKKRMR